MAPAPRTNRLRGIGAAQTTVGRLQEARLSFFVLSFFVLSFFVLSCFVRW